MKWLFVILFTALAIFPLLPSQPGSQVYAGQLSDQWMSFQRSLGLFFKSDEEIEELLRCKKSELHAYEDTLRKVEATIAKMQAEAGICRITGQPNQFILEKDPRPELQAKIDELDEEIILIEDRLAQQEE